MPAEAEFTPACMAQVFPIHPGGRGSLRTTVQAVVGAGIGGDGGGNVCGGVVALVVNEIDVQRSGVVLSEQCRQRVGQHVALVARRYDDRQGRPLERLGGGIDWREANVGTPEAAACQEQHEPRARGRNGERRA